MENHRLRVFREVVEQMSFRKAAEALHLSQPAVSQQIRALEEECGARLFERDGNQIAVTAAGRVLHGYALSAAALVEEAKTALGALNHMVSGQLRVGASTTIAQYILPRVLGAFHRQHPQVQLSVLSGNTEEIVEAVVAEGVALGLIEGPAMRRGLRVEPLMRDRMVLIAGGKGRSTETQAAISIEELTRLPLLMRERGSGSRRVVERALKHAGVAVNSLHAGMELDSTEAILSGVEAGLGVGFVSESAIGKELRLGTVRIVNLQGVAIERDFSLIYRAGQEPVGAAAAFRRFAAFDLRS
ncbi:DNA-binding transcriptional LysR family regulator [Granulicella aggregans]|uniref:DNA-binding transcriptional LysR family regulator n=1 Tax=Granulicella aggregans TaxID=474949 RepID=A0A7W8E2E3_9BACT|nr:LysR substrate-binding domain-containing protein [Granulicella aggregans]MBB5056793.1 DNA-binding transcriptional LysR family regulator [Granulicella aggregans]